MKPDVGHVQKAVQRALRARPGHSFTTRELLAWSHPRRCAVIARPAQLQPSDPARGRAAVRPGWEEMASWRAVENARSGRVDVDANMGKNCRGGNCWWRAADSVSASRQFRASRNFVS